MKKSRGLGMYLFVAAMVILLYSIITISAERDIIRFSYQDYTAAIEKDIISSVKIIPNEEVPTGTVELMLKTGKKARFNCSDVSEVEKLINGYSSRIYEKVADDADFMTLPGGYYKGKSSAKIEFNYDELAVEKDELETEANLLKKEYEEIEDIPVVVDLKKAHLGLVGESKVIHEQLHIMLAKLVLFQSYHDMEVVLLINQLYFLK